VRVGGLEPRPGSRHPIPLDSGRSRRGDGTDGDRVRHGLVIPGDFSRPPFFLTAAPRPSYIGPTISPYTVFVGPPCLFVTHSGGHEDTGRTSRDLSLRVAKAFIEDEGKASPAWCRSTAGSRGGARRLPADHRRRVHGGPCRPSHPALRRQGPGADRQASPGTTPQVSVDESCTVQKVPSKLADSVILSPVDARSQPPREQRSPHRSSCCRDFTW